MNKGNGYPGYKTDESVNNGSIEDETSVAEDSGAEDSVAEDLATDVELRPEANTFGLDSASAKPSASAKDASGLNVSTLSFLKKMHGVQENFARQLKTLSKKCEKWERRALNAEREVLAAEAVIERMVGLADSEMNAGVTTRKGKSVDSKGVKNVHKVSVIKSPTCTDDEPTILL